MKYCFDIDGTICTNTNGDYENATPIENRINLINDLYEKENEIILFTARGSTTNIDWKELTEQQLLMIKQSQIFCFSKNYENRIYARKAY